MVGGGGGGSSHQEPLSKTNTINLKKRGVIPAIKHPCQRRIQFINKMGGGIPFIKHLCQRLGESFNV